MGAIYRMYCTLNIGDKIIQFENASINNLSFYLLSINTNYCLVICSLLYCDSGRALITLQVPDLVWYI